MKRYKLLKDLPTFKAGEEFFISKSGNLIAGTPRNPKQITVKTLYGIPKKIDLMAYAQETLEEFPNILTDWFEEVEVTSSEYYYITDDGNVDFVVEEEPNLSRRRKAIGNIFETEEEAEKYIEYLKAKVIIKQDAKGAHFDWTDTSRVKYYGVWNCQPDILNKQLGLEYRRIITDRASTIYFNSKEDIKESFKKHPDEWKTYLTYEG